MSDKKFPEPVVGVLVENPKGEVLLIRSHKWNNKYVMPGGHIEVGEKMEDAARREILEETGLSIKDIKFVTFFEFIQEDSFYKSKHFIFFNFSAKTEDTEVTLNDEAQEYIWVIPKDALNLPLENYTRKTIEMIVNSMKQGIDYIGVSVGAMILNDQGEILLAKRSQTVKNERGCWENPGGSVEFGETLQSAVRREIKEEFGIEIELLEQFPAADHLIPNEKQHWLATTFLVKIKAGQTPKIMEPDKCDEIGWFSLDALPKPLSIITKIDLEFYAKKI